MAIELLKDRYSGPVNTVEIGKGLIMPSVKIGGQTGMPFLLDEGLMPNKPVVAYEILDSEPTDWPDHLVEAFGGAAKDPVRWAKFCVKELKAEAISIRLQSLHPDYGARPVDEVLHILKDIARTVGAPLIVTGTGDDERDNDIMPKVSQALKGENCLLGMATQNNYKTLAATCLADGHSLITDSPIDVNIAKQVNILVSDMGFDPKRIVMHPTTTSLGYGMEYVYSIMERSRLAAFMADKMLAMPFVVFIGDETWKTKEAKEYGKVQGINWELTTAVSMVQSGADLIVMRHPDAAGSLRKYIDRLSAGR